MACAAPIDMEPLARKLETSGEAGFAKERRGDKETTMLDVVVSCAYGGCHIPSAYQTDLRPNGEFDRHALAVARALTDDLNAPLYASTIARTLLDVEAPVERAVVIDLAEGLHQALLTEYYYPFRRALSNDIHEHIATRHRIVHLAIRSVQLPGDQLHLVARSSRSAEWQFVEQWCALLTAPRVGMTVRALACDDGHSLQHELRLRYAARSYLAVEVRLNRTWLASGHHNSVHLPLVTTLRQLVGAEQPQHKPMRPLPAGPQAATDPK